MILKLGIPVKEIHAGEIPMPDSFLSGFVTDVHSAQTQPSPSIYAERRLEEKGECLL
jgi:hypothetical protein